MERPYDFSDGTLFYKIIDKAAKTVSVTCETDDEPFYENPPSGEVEIPARVCHNGAIFTVVKIEYNAFEGCHHLASINIPSSVREIGSGTFDPCSALDAIDVHPDNPTYCSEAGVLLSKDKSILIAHPVGKKTAEYSIPHGVTAIEFDAFGNCPQLKKIEVPHSVEEISIETFDQCLALSVINIDSENPVYSSENGVLFNREKTLLIKCPRGKRGDFAIPDTVIEIGEFAFAGCAGLEKIDIPDSVTTIGGSAFDGCTGLATIRIPNSVTRIDEYAFWECRGLTEITIPNSAEEIAPHAFGCNTLTSILVESGNKRFCSVDGILFNHDKSTLAQYPAGRIASHYAIPDSVSQIGDGAFTDCKHLTHVEIPSTVTAIGSDAFWKCNGIAALTIPDSVTQIGNSAFADCESLKKIALPNSLTTIEWDLFRGCTTLAQIALPTSVTEVKGAAFADCLSLKKIALPDKLTAIEWMLFKGCTALTQVCMPNSIARIEEYAFVDCTALTAVTIPRSVDEIGPCAFDGCTALESITLHITNPNQIRVHDFQVFTNVPKDTCTLHVPAGCKARYAAAEIWKDFENIVEIGI